MKALVTGGAGFIGSHIIDALIEKGLDVVCVDDLSNGKPENINKKAKFHKINILNQSKLKKIFSKEKFDFVFHEAALVSIRNSLTNFYGDSQTNVLGTLSIIEACKLHPPKRLIYASSMGVYADSLNRKSLKESDKTEPLSPYGISKLASEKYIELLCPSLGIEYAILRYFNTYGPRQKFSPYVGVITIFSKLLKKGKTPIIYGDGTQCRDFIHVQDVSRANICAMVTKHSNEVYNIGTGEASSINYIYKLISRVYSQDNKPKYLKKDETELNYAVADTQKAATKLKFKSKIKLDVEQIRTLFSE